MSRIKNPITPSAADAWHFRKCWIAEIQKHVRLVRKNAAPVISAWEGHEASRELIDRNNLWLVLPNRLTRDWPFRRLADRLSREVYFYKRFCNFIVPANQYFKDAISAVSTAKAKLNRARLEDSPIKQQLQVNLKDCSALLEKTLDTLKESQQSHWKETLFTLSKERRSWLVSLDDDREVRSVPPPGLAEWEQIFDKANYPTRLVKRIDLDKRFQTRVAVILRFFLPRDFRVSLRTIR